MYNQFNSRNTNMKKIMMLQVILSLYVEFAWNLNLMIIGSLTFVNAQEQCPYMQNV